MHGFGQCLWLVCAVPVQPRLEVWTTAVEGTGKSLEEKTLLQDPKSLPRSAVKHTRFTLRHWYTHINMQSVMTELTISGYFDLLVKCPVTKEKRSVLLMTVDGA